MNLARAQKALLAVQRCEHRHLHVRRPANDADVREMVQEGFLNADLSEDPHVRATVIASLTDGGRRFLQMFPATYRLCEARSAVVTP